MRIFLTGASGHVGTPLLKLLVKEGHDVTILLRPQTINLPLSMDFALKAKPKGYNIIYGSLQECRKAKDAIEAADALIHLASPRSNNRDVAIREDILGMAALTEMRKQGPFIYTSSQTVYGIPQGDLHENTGFAPSCWYDIAKIANEVQLAETSSICPDLIGISLRMALLLSARKGDTKPQYLQYLIDAVTSERTFIFRDEEALFTYGTSYIGEIDLSRSILHSLSLKASGPFNISGGFSTWKDLLEKIGTRVGKTVRYRVGKDAITESDELRLPQSRSFMVTDKFNREVSFLPSQPLDDIIEKAIY